MEEVSQIDRSNKIENTLKLSLLSSILISTGLSNIILASISGIPTSKKPRGWPHNMDDSIVTIEGKRKKGNEECKVTITSKIEYKFVKQIRRTDAINLR